MGRLIIDGNDVYEIDEECILEKERAEQLRLDAEKQKRANQKTVYQKAENQKQANQKTAYQKVENQKDAYQKHSGRK